MTPTLYAVLLVHSTNHALRAEKALQELGVPCKLIPVPRRLSSDCGVCIRVQAADGERALRALEEIGLEIGAVHYL